MFWRRRSHRSTTAAATTEVTAPATPPTRRVYRVGGRIGSQIVFAGKPPLQAGATGQVHGWKTTTPTRGDYLTGRFDGGMDVIARFTAVSRYSDPPDMFWAEVELVSMVPSGQLMNELQQLEPTATIVAVDRWS